MRDRLSASCGIHEAPFNSADNWRQHSESVWEVFKNLTDEKLAPETQLGATDCG